MGNYFEVRQGTDKEWGIYLRAYNIRIATFSRGATEERKMIKKLIENWPKVTVGQIEKLIDRLQDECNELEWCFGRSDRDEEWAELDKDKSTRIIKEWLKSIGVVVEKEASDEKN